MRKVISVLALMVFVITISLAQLANSSWPMYRHDPQHTGRSIYNGPSSPAKKWEFSAGNGFVSSPAVGSDGTIYFGSEDKNLYALNSDGSKKWQFTTGGSMNSSPAIDSNGIIYIGSWDNKLYAINSDGTKKWEFASGKPIQASPVIDANGMIFIASEDGKLYAINSDGTKKWEYDVGSVISSPALATDGTIYVGTMGGMLYAVNSDGTKKWEFKTGGAIYGSAPLLGTDGTVYVGSEDTKLYAINPDGTKKWEFTTGAKVNSPPGIGADGTIYVGSEDSKVYAINPDGTKKWELKTGGNIESSGPAIDAQGTVYIGSTDKKLYAINPDGTKKWEFDTNVEIWTPPSITSDGTIYVTTKDRKVFAITETPSSITVTSPNGNEKWAQGSTQNITWTSTGTTGNVKLELYKNGVLNSTIAASVANIGTYSWKIPAGQTIGTDYKVKISAVADAKITDSSDADFSIYTPIIHPWPMKGHDIKHTGNSPYNGPSNPIQKWVFTTGAPIYSTTAINQSGLIHSGSTDGKLYTLNPDGTEKWRFTAGASIESSSLLSPDGSIYVGSFDKYFYALNADGTQKWKFTTGTVVQGSATLSSDGILYIGSWDNYLYAINPDGTQKWKFKTGAMINASPAIGSDGTIYIGSFDSKLYAINPDGTKKWEFTTGAKIMPSPTVSANGTIYVCSYDKYIYAINSDGTEKWKFLTGDVLHWSSPAIATDGTIYVGSYDNKLHAINPDGTKKWEFSTKDQILSSPTIGNDGMIYFGSSDSNIYAVLPDGTEAWEFKTGGPIFSSPSIGADGTLYVGSNDKNLYAITNTNATLTLPNGGESWMQGSTQIITWKNINVPGNVKLELYKGGTLNSTIAASVANTGTYSWTIPTVQTIGTDYKVKISAVANAKITDTSDANFAITATPTLGIPVQLSPSNNAVNVTAPVTIAWQAVNSAVNYEYELYGPASATVPVETNTVTTTTATIQYSVIAGTKYNWRVRAIDAKDVKSTYSPKWSFTIQALPTIGTPVLTFPLNNATGIALSPALTWQSAANATVYSVEVATNAGFTTPFVSTQNVTATTYSLTNLTNSTKYYWRVKGGDGTRWGTAATANFTTAAKQSISVPVLTSPEKAATGVAISTALTWQAVNNAVSYTVQYATNSNFNNATEVIATNLTTDVTMLVNTRYFWRVKATDADGNSSNWAPAWYFNTINQTVQLTAPTLIAPADGAVDVPANTTFTWTSVANALAYDVDISIDANFTTKATLSSATASLTKTLANSTVYYWRVRGKQGNNLGIWSTVNTFTTGALVPTFGVDAAISQSRPGSQLFGTGVINNTGDMQTVQLFQQINRQSEFYIVLTNTGNIPDNFLITTTSTVDSKWKVAVCDNGGIDRTVKVFGNGWISYTVKPGESTKLLMRFSAASKQIIDAANPPTLSIAITAKSYNDITNGSTTPASDTVVGTAILTKMSTIK